MWPQNEYNPNNPQLPQEIPENQEVHIGDDYVVPEGTALGATQPVEGNSGLLKAFRQHLALVEWPQLVAALLVIVLFAVLGVVAYQKTTNNSDLANQAGEIISIPLGELGDGAPLAIDQSRQLQINGRLTVNNSFVLTPTTEPDNPVAGQLYLNAQNNQLYYHNGTNYVALADSSQVTSSLGGVRGDITLGAGLAIDSNQLRNSGVLSVQGVTGDVVFSATQGIGISGTSLSNTGVLSIQGQTGNVALTAGGGISVNGTTIANTGVTGLAGTVNQISVSSGNGDVVLSLPQDIAATSSPTFAGLTLTGGLTTGAITPSGSGLTIGADGQPLTLAGNDATVLRAANGGWATTIGFATPTANVTYLFQTAAGGTYEICSTAGNCAGVGGGVTTSGGTINRLAKFTGAQGIGDSSITDDGITVSLGANLNVSGNSALTGNLTVSGAATVATLNGLSLDDQAVGFVISGGTTSKTLTVSETAVIDQNISTSSNVVFNTVNSTGNTGVGGNLNVAGSSSLSGTLSVAGSTSLSGDLTMVSGTTLFTNRLQQTGAGNNLTIDAGADQLVFQANGRVFQFPSSGVTNQTICTTGITCASGSGEAVVIAPGSAQTDSSLEVSIFLNDTGGGNLLQLQQGGVDRFVVSGAGAVTAASFQGDGSSLTNLNASNVATGTLNNARLSAIVSLLGQTIESSEITDSTLLEADLSASNAPVNGQILTFNNTSGGFTWVDSDSVGAADVDSVNSLTGALTLQGTANQVLVTDDGVGIITLALPQDINTTASPTFAGLTINGSVSVTGNVAAATFSGNGANLTALNASNVATGTLNDARLSANVSLLGQTIETAEVTDSTLLEADLNATNIATGGQILTFDTTSGGFTWVSPDSVGAADVDSINGLSGALTLQGTLNQITVTDNGTNTFTLSLPQDINTTSSPTFAGLTINGSMTVSSSVTAASFTGNGASLTSLNASNVATGTLADARLSANVTLQGNTFNGANQLVQLNASGFLPSLNGSLLTNLNASALASGTLDNARLSALVSLLGQTIESGEITDGTVLETDFSATNAASNGQILTYDTTTGGFTWVDSSSVGDEDVDSLNSLTGALTLQGTTGQVDIASNGTDTLTVSLDANVSLLGQTIGTTEIENLAVTNAKLANSSITISNGTNVTGGGTVALGGTITLGTVNNPTFSTSVATPLLSLGSSTQLGQLVWGDGLSAFTGTMSTAALTANRTYTLPDIDGTFCTTGGNCAGVGGGVTTAGGTVNRLAKFTAGQAIGDSNITDDGVLVTTLTSLAVQGSSLTIGAASTTTGSASFFNSTNGFRVTIQGVAATANRTINLPDNNGTFAVAANGPISLSADGIISCPTCTTGGGGSGGAVDSLNSLNGALTLQGTTNQVTVTDNGTNTITLSLPQDINATASPTFGGLTVNGSLAVSGAATVATLNGVAITANADGFSIAGGTTSRTLTVSGANVSLNQDLLTTSSPTFGGLTVNGDINANGNIILAANQSLTIVGGATGTRPASPTEGMVYFDTTTKQLLTYSNGKWQGDRSTTTKIVAASNSTQTAKDAADYVADGNTGAAGDGDQVQINQAIEAVNAVGGGTVYLVEGTYTVDASIKVRSNITLEGSGNPTVITIPNTSSNLDVLVNYDITTSTANTNIVVRNLRLNGNKDNNQQFGGFHTGVEFYGASPVKANILFDKVTIEEFTGTPLFIGGHSDSAITNSVIQENGRGMDVYEATNMSIRNNTFINNTMHALATYLAVNSRIQNNTFEGNGYGMYVEGASGNPATNMEISGNIITNSTNVGIYALHIENSSFTDNILSSITGAGLSLNMSNNNIAGSNKLHNTGGSTLNNAVFLNDSDSNTITGNTIADTSATTTNYAINISNNTSDSNYLASNTLGGGTINDSGTGTIYSNQIGNNGAITNRTANTTTAFQVQNAAGTSVLNVDTANQRVGIGISAPTETLHVVGNGLFQGNLIVSNGTNTGTFQLSALTANRTYTLPDEDGTLCLTSGNCAGAGSGLTGSGTAGYIAQFDAAQNLVNSPLFNLSGNIGIGTTDPDFKLEVAGSATFGSNSSVLDIFAGDLGLGVYQDITTNRGGTDLYSAYNTLRVTSAQTGTPTGYGSRNVARINSGNIGELVGVQGEALGFGTGTVSSITGVAGVLANATTGTITNAYGLRVKNIIQNDGTITNTYGVHVGDITTGTQTNTPYSFYASDPNAWNYFAGNVGIGTATSPTEKLHVVGNGLFQGGIKFTDGTTTDLEIRRSGSSAIAFTSPNDGNRGVALSLGSGGATFRWTGALAGTATPLFQFDATSSMTKQILGLRQGTSSTGSFLENLNGSGGTLSGFNNAGNLFYKNSGFTSTLQSATLTANRTYTLPDADGTVCLSGNNCGYQASGNYFTQGGNSFGEAAVIGTNDSNSLIFRTNGGTRVTINSTGNVNFGAFIGGTKFSISPSATNIGQVIQGSAGQSSDLFQLRNDSSAVLSGFNATGNLFFNNSTFAGTLQSATLTANRTYTLPDADGTFCLSSGNCGSGPANVSSLNSLNGALTLQGTANQITVTDNGTNTITLSLPQDINTTSSPTFAGLTVNGAATIAGTLTGGLLNEGFTIRSNNTNGDEDRIHLVLDYDNTTATNYQSVIAIERNGILFGPAQNTMYLTGPAQRQLVVRGGDANDLNDEIGFDIDTDLSATTTYTRVLTVDPGNGGSIGIGTQTPGAKLHVVGNSLFQGTLGLSNGTNTGTFSLGTLTANRTYTLPDADGTLCLTSGNCAGAGGGITGSGTANRLAVFDAAQNIVDSYLLQSASALTLDAGKNLVVNTNTLFVDAANNRVGVGTAIPNALLHLSSSDSIASQNSGGAMIRIQNTSTANNRAVLRLTKADGTSGTHYGDFRLSNTGKIEIATGMSSGDLDTPKLVVTSSGNIGIGTTAPSQKLTLQAGNFLNTANSASLTDAGALNSGDIILQGHYDSDATTGITATARTMSLRNIVSTTGAERLAVLNNAGSEFVSFDGANSRVGIGATAPDAKLHINTGADATVGQIIRANSATQTADLLQIQNSTGGNLLNFTAAGQLQFGDGTTTDLAIRRTAAATIAFTRPNSSDRGLTLNVSSDGAHFSWTGPMANTVGPQFTFTGLNNAKTVLSALRHSSATGNLFEVGVASGSVYSGFNNTGNLFYKNSGFTGTLQSATLTANRTYTLPDEDGTLCLTSGNCAGAGSGLTGSGTAGYIAQFDAAQNLVNSPLFNLSGNIGIGTTAPSQKLTLQAGNFLNTANSTTLADGSSLNSGDLILQGYYDSDGTTGITATARTMSLRNIVSTTGAERLAVLNNAGSEFVSFDGANSRLGIGATAPDAKLHVNTGADATVGQIIRANSATQTSDLQQWQNSAGTSLLTVSPTGALVGSADVMVEAYMNNGKALRVGSLGLGRYYRTGYNISGDLIDNGSAFNFIATGASNNPFVFSGAAGLQVSNSSAGAPAFLVKGAASQTGDMLQLRNSSNTILSGFNASGNLYFNNSTFAGTLQSATLTANRTYTLPDEDGTICIQGSANCGFATGSGTAFVQGGNSFGAEAVLGTNDPQKLALRTNGFNRLTINSSGQISMGTGGAKLGVGPSATEVGLIVKGAVSQTADLLQIRNSVDAVLSGFNATGSLFMAPIGTANATTQYASGNMILQGSSWDTTANGGAGGAVSNQFSLRNTGLSGAGNLYRFGLVNNDGTEVLSVLESGNVGIGTTGPGYKLDVNGTGAFVSNLYVRRSASCCGSDLLTLSAGDSVSTVASGGGQGEGLILSASSSTAGIFFRTGGSSADRMLINSSGDVGIGTNPGYKLDVAGDINTTGAYRVNGVQISSANLSDSANLAKLDGTQSFTGVNTFTAAGTALSVTNNATIGGTLSVGTNLSYGQLTLGNDQWLTAVNAAGTGGINILKVNAQNQIQLGTALSVDGGFIFPEDAGMVSFTDMPVTAASPIGTAMGYTFNVDSDNVLTVYAESNGTGGVQNRRVGIGTATPTSTLHVVGDGTFDGDVAVNGGNIDATGGLTIRAAAGTAALYSTVNNFGINANINGDTTLRISNSSTRQLLVQDQANATKFSIQGDDGEAYFSGNVGIGIATPGYRLDVQGGSINTSGGVYTAGTERITSGGNLTNIGSITTLGTGNITLNPGNGGTGTVTIAGNGGYSNDIFIGRNGGGGGAKLIEIGTLIGASTGSSNIKIGTLIGASTGSSTIAIGTSEGQTTTVTLGSTAAASTTTIQGGGGILLNPSAGNVGIGTAVPGNKLSVNALTAADSLAQVAVSTGATTNKGLVIQGVASQTADLQQWQNDAGTSLMSVSSDGTLKLRNVSTIGWASSTGAPVLINPRIGEIVSGTTHRGLRITYNSGIDPLYSSNNSTRIIDANSAFPIFETSGLGFISQSASRGMIIRGAASQTGDLLQLQNSAGAVLSGFNATGNLFFNNSTFAGTLQSGTLTANRTYTLPDEDGTVCLQGSANCGFATGSGQAFVQGGNSFGATAVLGTDDAQSLEFHTGGLYSMGINATGQVGIWSAPSASDQLLVTSGSSSVRALMVQALGGGDVAGFYVGSNNVFSIGKATNGGAILAKNTINTTAAFQVQNAAGTSVFNVDTTNQRVGVGTASPQSKLDVNGNIGLSAANPELIVNNVGSGATAFTLRENGGVALLTVKDWGTIAGNVTSGIYGAGLSGANTASFYHTTSTDTGLGFPATDSLSLLTAGSQRLTIDSSGNVGIGTTAPEQRLDINGTAQLRRLADATSGANFVNSNTLRLQGAYWDGSVSQNANWDIRNIVYGQAGGPKYRLGIIDNDGNERLTIDGTGSIGIGNTDPFGKLDISTGNDSTVGQIIRANSATQSANLWQLRNSSNAVLSGFNSSGNLFYNNSGFAGTLQSATLTANRTYTLPDADGTLCIQGSANCGFTTGSGTAFVQGGNSFGASAVLGTADTNNLEFRTNNSYRGQIDSNGLWHIGWFPGTDARLMVAENSTGGALSVTNYSTGNIAAFYKSTSNVFNIANNGAVLAKNATNSATAFQVQNAAGTSVFNVDTTNKTVGIGTNAPTSVLHVLGSQPAAVAANGTNATQALQVTGGQGGNTTGTTGQVAGTGAVLNLTAGAGGNAPAGSTNGNGGSITLQGGAPGAGAGTAGSYGNIILASSGGNVGIGKSDPGAKLDIYQATSTSDVDLFRILSDVGSVGNVKFRIDSDGDIFTDGSTTIGSGADLAEKYRNNDGAKPGDVVVFNGKDSVATSSGTYQTGLAGVVATNPGLILSGDTPGVSVALSGRVPVKVTAANGEIKPGDYLTSAAGGKAQKATAAGPVIGTALEGTSTDGIIEVFVHLGYYNPATGEGIQNTGSLQNGSDASFASLNVSGATTLASLTVKGDATIQGKLTVKEVVITASLTVNGHIITIGNQPVIEVAAGLGQDRAASATITEVKVKAEVDGTDTAGTITLVAGTEAAKGILATVEFAKEYAQLPRIALTATNEDGLSLPVFVRKTATGFELVTTAVPVEGKTYQFDYIIIGSEGTSQEVSSQ